MADRPVPALIDYGIIDRDYIGEPYTEMPDKPSYGGVDWTATMQQTFEYYVVDPLTWMDKSAITDVISSSITWDSSTDTLGSASLNVSNSLGECYVRIYLITIQNGVREKHPLGTFLVQTPSFSFDGKSKSITLDAYTPLLELKENYPPLGYSILEGENVLDAAFKIVREQARAPIYKPTTNHNLYFNFVSNINDTWITFVSDLIGNAGDGYRIGLDELGRIIFLPTQNTKSLQPVWTYNDDNSSILMPSVSLDHDLYGIPNVVEVVYSKEKEHYIGVAVNDDPNSPISTVARGRRITHRVTNPSIPGNPTKAQIEEHAKMILREMSILEYTVTYTHGYCPVRIGDCVRLNYERAGLKNVKAKVISQTIDCVPGCPVTEKAVFTTELWR